MVNLARQMERELMDSMIPFLNKELQRIYSLQEAQFLHGDLNPWNVRICGDQLSILDFEVTI